MKRWYVNIEHGHWMEGTHIFHTKKSAIKFIATWSKSNPNDTSAIKLL